MTRLMYLITLLFVLPWIVWLGYSSESLENTTMASQANDQFMKIKNNTDAMIPSIEGGISDPLTFIGSLIDSTFSFFWGFFSIIGDLTTSPAAFFNIVDIPTEISFGIGALLTAIFVISGISWLRGSNI